MSNESWKNHGGNNTHRNIRTDNLNYNSGTWNEDVSIRFKKYYKTSGAPSILGIGTDSPYSRLSFGESGNKNNAGRIDYNSASFALYEGSQGSNAVGMSYIDNSQDNNNQTIQKEHYLGVYVDTDNRAYFMDNSQNAMTYFTKDIVYINKYPETIGLYNMDISGSIKTSQSITINECVLDESQIEDGTLQYKNNNLQLRQNGGWINITINTEDNNNIFSIEEYVYGGMQIPDRINYLTSSSRIMFGITPSDLSDQSNETQYNELSVKGNLTVTNSENLKYKIKNMVDGVDVSGNLSLFGSIGLGGSFDMSGCAIDISAVRGGIIKTGDSVVNELYSIAIGKNCKVHGGAQYSMSLGKEVDISGGSYNINMGGEGEIIQYIDGSFNFMVGSGNKIVSDYNIVQGVNNKSENDYNFIMGNGNKINDGINNSNDLSSNLVMGTLNLSNRISNSIIIGSKNNAKYGSKHDDAYDNSQNSVYILGNNNNIYDISDNFNAYILGNNCDASRNNAFVIGLSGNAIVMDTSNNITVHGETRFLKSINVVDISANGKVDCFDLSCATIISSGDLTTSGINSSNIVSSGTIHCLDLSCANVISSGNLDCLDLSCANVISSGNLDCLDLSCANVISSGNLDCLDLSCVDISSSGNIHCLDLSCVDISASGNITCVNFDSTNIVSSSITNSIIKYEEKVITDNTTAGGDSNQTFPNSFYSINTTNTGITFDLQNANNNNIGQIIYIYNSNTSDDITIKIDSTTNDILAAGTVKSYICVAANTWKHVQ